ncbi:MAG: hypothetical protein HYX49_08870 [Chloroflexi bacterium]|nr:hypothetical protein [Chloroflexota bacterium]
MNISDVAQILRNAPRMGAEKDEPEGTRFIQISDSLAEKIAQELESWIDGSTWELPEGWHDKPTPKLIGENIAKMNDLLNKLDELEIDAHLTQVFYGVYKTTAIFKTSNNREGKIRLHEGKWQLFWKDKESIFP